MTLGIPPNDNGSGYVCYSRAGLDKPNAVTRKTTTQVFEGGEDLDIGPAVRGETVTIGRIWCDAGFSIELAPEGTADGLVFTVLDPDHKPLSLHNGKAKTTTHGWNTLQVSSVATGVTPFKLAVTWTSTQTL